MTQYLLLLAIVPMACYQLATLNASSRKWMSTGMAYGLVVAPVSLSLAKWIFIGGIGKVVGSFGVFLNIIHGTVGYLMATFAGIIAPGITLSSMDVVIVNVLNGLLWCSFYGSLGYNLDLKLAKEQYGQAPWRIAHTKKAA